MDYKDIPSCSSKSMIDDVFGVSEIETTESPAPINLDEVDDDLLKVCGFRQSGKPTPSPFTEAELNSIFENNAKPQSNLLVSQLPFPAKDTLPSCNKADTVLPESKDNCEELMNVSPAFNLQADSNHNSSLSNSMIDYIFMEKEKMERKVKEDWNDSSLSVIDLEAIDDNADLFTLPNAPHHTPAPNPALNPLAQHMDCASPIPIDSDIGLRVTQTPAKAHTVSSPFGSPSEERAENKRVLSISSSTASPIQTNTIVASTPFHGRLLSSCSDTTGVGGSNRTYNIDEQHMDVSTNAMIPRPTDTTYSEKTTATNVTFTTTTKNETFNKTSPDLLPTVRPNETFDVVVGSVTDSSVPAPEMSPTNSDVVMKKSGVTSALTKATHKDDKPKSQLRRPLSALNNAGNSQLKAPQTQKRVSKLQAPRMNTAAISRIQARSPPKLESDAQDENVSTSMKPPSNVTSLRKPQARKIPAAPRRSLLPPSNAKARPNSSTVKKTSPRCKQAAVSDTQLTYGKRKLESPSKRSSRAPKSDAALVKPSTSTTSSLRNNGQITARPTTLASRPSSKLQRTQASSIPPPRPNYSSSTSVAATELGRPKSRVITGRLQQKKEIKPEPSQQRTQQGVGKRQTVVALATLLDYVVNRLDGLSAPKLAADKQHLQRLVTDQNTSNVSLSSRLDELEVALSQSREAHERDVRDATQRHEQFMKELKEDHESKEQLSREKFQEITRELSRQESDHEEVLTRLKLENQRTVEDLEMKHEEEIGQMRHEWSEERAEIEKETLELRETMNAKVQAKVEELIQPYINSFEENKSLRTVLEMKSSEVHKLNLEISQQGNHLNQVRDLNDHVISLQQRNEDLQTQVEEKNKEQRELKQELAQTRRNLEEQQHVSSSQQQRIEELSYKLDSTSPTPSSPFNPVFTPSPSTGGQPPSVTPMRRRPLRSSKSEEPMRTPSKLAKNGDDVCVIAHENGMT